MAIDQLLIRRRDVPNWRPVPLRNEGLLQLCALRDLVDEPLHEFRALLTHFGRQLLDVVPEPEEDEPITEGNGTEAIGAWRELGADVGLSLRNSAAPKGHRCGT